MVDWISAWPFQQERLQKSCLVNKGEVLWPFTTWHKKSASLPPYSVGCSSHKEPPSGSRGKNYLISHWKEYQKIYGHIFKSTYPTFTLAFPSTTIRKKMFSTQQPEWSDLVEMKSRCHSFAQIHPMTPVSLRVKAKILTIARRPITHMTWSSLTHSVLLCSELTIFQSHWSK